ncbi:MAG: ABC transporter permease [Actinomycetota bacterium]|nr:ABC transporter permease [Actinomycetota bacterium]
MTAVATMTPTAWLRIFFRGGLTSYRALFNWIRPAILIPTFVVLPIFQILLFVYIGRSAGIESDEFFVIGNALQFAATPCLFAMADTISGERQQHTLSLILVSPAPRIPLFLGRSLPVIANGFLASAFALLAAGLLLGIDVPSGAVLPLVLTIAVTSLSCTGLGLVNAALGLRVRETAVLSNVIFGVLLVFCGVNVPLARLPHWMAVVSDYLPLTHGIAAARQLAGGAHLGTVAGLIGWELLVGTCYVAVGFALLQVLERESRRTASLDRF